MDFFTGSVPRKLISFRLGMSSDKDQSQQASTSLNTEQLTVDVIPPKSGEKDDSPSNSGQANTPSSGSSDGDVNLYAEGYLASRTDIGDPHINMVSSVPPSSTPTSDTVSKVTEVPQDDNVVPPEKTSDSVTIVVEKDKEKDVSTEPPKAPSCGFESDVMSLGECTKLPETVYPATDASEVGVDNGESCLKLLKRDQVSRSTATGYCASDNDADLSGNDGEEDNTGLNSMDTLPHLRPMNKDSRALLKECFDQNVPIRLPQGQQTIAFSEEQVYQMLRVMSNETVHASYQMMQGLLISASRLPTQGQSSSTKPPPKIIKRPRSCTPARRDIDSTSEGEVEEPNNPADGFTSGCLQSGDSDCSLTSKPSDSVRVASSSVSETPLNDSDPKDPVRLEISGSSQEDLPLSVFKETHNPEDPLLHSPVKDTRSIGVGDPPPTKKPRVSRPGKIFKESYFHKMDWARPFVSGPMDPLDNPYCFYCQICKRNVSIYGKGALEVKRHYSSRDHFRRDQKWRYVNLRQEDPLSGVVTHFVRDRAGKLLSKMDLKLELPLFEQVELVDIGDKLPFYDDVKGAGDAKATSRSRASTQISLLGDYLKTGGNIEELRRIWLNVGSFTHHQSMFADFDWSCDRISVSIFKFSCR